MKTNKETNQNNIGNIFTIKIDPTNPATLDTIVETAYKLMLAQLGEAIKYKTDKELRNIAMNAMIQVASVTDPSFIRKLKNKFPAKMIALMMNHKYCIRTIDLAGINDDLNDVYIYDSDTGLYTSSEKKFREIIEQYSFTFTTKDKEEIMFHLKAIAITIKPCKDRDLIAVGNGIFNYQTRKLVPFSPDYCFTHKIPIDYKPSISPKIKMPDGLYWDFDSWIDDISDDPEVIDLLWRIIGAIIRPNVRWDKIVFLYSNVGCNAKGTFAQLLKNICGEGRYESIRIQDFAEDKYVSKLVTATAVITDENPVNWFSKDVSNLKAVSTGDTITVDRKYKEAITFRYSGLIVQCVNSLPKTGDATSSYYRRLLMIPFTKTFIQSERKYIKADFLGRKDVLEYVIWKVLNLPAYYDLPVPNACKQLLSDFKEVNDPVLQFCTEIIPDLAWDKVPQAFLYDLYKVWNKENNPCGIGLGKQGFLEKVKAYISDGTITGWEYSSASTRINTSDNVKTEMLIYEYGLDRWMNHSYRGGDPKKMCMTDFKDSYKGMFIRK